MKLKTTPSFLYNLLQDRAKMLVLFFIFGAAGFYLMMFQIILTLPDVEKISSLIPAESTIFYAINGDEIARLHEEENRQIVPLSKISPYLIQCVLVTEDSRFYQHHGIDVSGIFRALFANLRYGRMQQGGSTITQQLARSLFLTRQKTISRKIAEAILALEIEKKYTKEEILALYLNNVYWGHNAYGVESAAKLYFGKPAQDLDLAEAALLTGLLKGPEIYSPYKNLAMAKKKQAYVLSRLVTSQIISPQTAEEAEREVFVFPQSRRAQFGHIAPYFVSYLLKSLTDKYGEKLIYEGGLKVYTTLDLNMQKAAEEIIATFIEKEGKTYNFSQAALVAIDPRTGYIKAMVGGADYSESKFNRVTQARRQPGSAFKPFIYTAAMEQGLSPGTIIIDEEKSWRVPISKWTPLGRWTPQNFDKKYHGAVTLRQALELSLNVPAVKLIEKVGVGKTLNVARRMGITSPLSPVLALALGASEVTLLEMTSAFGVFANSGVLVEPVAIIKITNRQGKELEHYRPIEKKALNPNIAAAMVDIMRGVLTRGTGYKGRITRDAAAKTGTTQDFKDAWFIGFVPQLSTGVWVGNDNNARMKGIAEVAVCPRIWKNFVQLALKDVPVQNFPAVQGMISVRICLDSGQRATEACPANCVKTLTFWKNRAPNESCQIHLKINEDANNPELLINEPPPEGFLIR
jgi:penicillin-binding protein 1A